jgi:hypothetical protein
VSSKTSSWSPEERQRVERKERVCQIFAQDFASGLLLLQMHMDKTGTVACRSTRGRSSCWSDQRKGLGNVNFSDG